MQTDPWLSETRREAQRQREWALRDRGAPTTRSPFLARLVLRALVEWLAIAFMFGACAVVAVWLVVEVVS